MREICIKKYLGENMKGNNEKHKRTGKNKNKLMKIE
jgi:hypothetical protein